MSAERPSTVRWAAFLSCRYIAVTVPPRSGRHVVTRFGSPTAQDRRMEPEHSLSGEPPHTACLDFSGLTDADASAVRMAIARAEIRGCAGPVHAMAVVDAIAREGHLVCGAS
jgi:hypothetical protein